MASDKAPYISPLDSASERLAAAFGTLETIADRIASTPRNGASAAERAAIEAEITRSWEAHCANLETDLAAARQDAEDLRNENIRLSNQLQILQQEHLELQHLTDSVADRLDQQVRQLDLIAQ